MTAKKSEKTKTSNQPSHIVWFVEDLGEDRKPIWHRIGAQWPTKNGKGFRQTLKFFPNANGQLVVMPNEPKENDNDTEDGA